MKKILKSLFIVCVIIMLFLLYYLNTQKININGKIISTEYYLKNSSSGKIVTKTNNRLTVLNKKGQAYVLDNNINVNELLKELNASLVFVEMGDWGQNFYAYSKDIKYFKTISCKKVNVHIAVCDQKKQTKIGFPIIYGSF